MLNLLLFVLFGVGLTNILVNASILDYFRDFITERSFFFGKLLSCMLCTGFWVGISSALFFDYNLFIGASIISLAGDFYSSVVEAIDSWALKNAVILNESEDDKDE